MICGVQGDFTRSLVNDPPKTLWTRELKVRAFSLRYARPHSHILCSLPVSRTRRRYTSVVSVSARARASVLLSQRASNLLTGESRRAAESSPSSLTTYDRFRYLIWIGKFAHSIPPTCA